MAAWTAASKPARHHGRAGTICSAPSGLGQFRAVLANLETTTAQAGPAVKEFRELIGKIDESAANIDRFADTVGDGLMTSSLPRLNALLQELTATSRQLSSLFQELRHHRKCCSLGEAIRIQDPANRGLKRRACSATRKGRANDDIRRSLGSRCRRCLSGLRLQQLRAPADAVLGS